MIKSLFLALATVLTCAAEPAAKGKRVIVHVPEQVDSIRPFRPVSANYNHVQIVNVGNAIDPNDWGVIVSFAMSRIKINAWTNSIEKTIVPALVSGSTTLDKALGPNAKVAVFIEDCDGPSKFLSSAGEWCRVNVRQLKADNPDRQTLRDRLAKSILKGVVYAAACGSGYDQASVAGYKALTLNGLDECVMAITPEAYFPMLQSLKQIGGDKIVSPAVE